jgi:hypothetical protein
MENANWWWFDTIQQTPAYIQELKPFELEELALMITSERNKILAELAQVQMANVGREITPGMFPELARLDFLESTLTAEKVRRGRVVPPQKETPQPEPLPAFDDAINDKAKLPELWEALSLMEKPFLTSEGFVRGGAKARKHREVMALAQVIAAPLMGGRSQYEVYSMLCKRVGLNESGRSDKIPERPGYDDLFREITKALHDVRK